MNNDTYARLYHRLSREYPHVYADDRALATYVRLLVLADAAWPIRPPLPRSVRRPTLVLLTTAVEIDNQPRPGLVILDGDCYTILGLDAERTRRGNAARTGAAVRWENERNADRNANASAVAMPSRAEQSRAEDSPPPQAGRRKDGTNPRAVGTNPRATGTAPRQLRQAEKRLGMPLNVQAILRAAAEGKTA